MSRYHGRQGKGGSKAVRARKRQEAEIRNSTTWYRRRRKWRLKHLEKA